MYGVIGWSILFIIAVLCIFGGLWFKSHRKCFSCAQWTKKKYFYCPHCGQHCDADLYSEADLALPPATITSSVRHRSSPSTYLNGSRRHSRIYIDESPSSVVKPASSSRRPPGRATRAISSLPENEILKHIPKRPRRIVSFSPEEMPHSTRRLSNQPEEMPPRGQSIRFGAIPRRPRVVIRNDDDVSTAPSRYKRPYTLINKRLYCPSCQATVHEYDDFCGNCGAQMMMM